MEHNLTLCYQKQALGSLLLVQANVLFSSQTISHLDAFLDGFEQCYSRFRPGNVLYELNTCKGVFPLSKEAQTLFDLSKFLHHATHGVFDITCLRVLEKLGYGSVYVCDYQKQNTLSFSSIELGDGWVNLHGALVEFGGIGKGFVIDCLYHIIQENEPGSVFFLNFGGDIRVSFLQTVGLEHPYDPQKIIATHVLPAGRSLGASSHVKHAFGGAHHIIDPATSCPAHEVIASFVDAATAALADGFATALCATSVAQAREILLQNSNSISGAIVCHDGKIFSSSGFLQ